MKAAERRRKRLLEKSKQSLESDNNEVNKKKIAAIPSIKSEIKITNPENANEINNENIIQNISSSKPGNNMDMEKISQKIKERKEKRKRKNMNESGINPTFKDSNNNINAINENNINNNNSINNNRNRLKEKDSNKLLGSIESMGSITGQKKVNFSIKSKDINLENNNNINNNINNKQLSVSSSNNSINNYNNKDIPSITSTPNYQLLSKNYANIKNENIEEFLAKTNPDKPSDEQKESEVKKMIEVMDLRPNPKNANNQAILNDEKNYAYNLTRKIEDNNDYYENQKEIKKLIEIVKEEERNTEQMLERNKEEIQKYIEKIISLQNTLINSKQGDIVALEEANKIDDIQINNLSVTYQRLKEENEKEKNRMLSLINKEIIPLQKELKNEIKEVQNLKNQLLKWDKKAPPRDILKKIEVVMKYMKNCS